MKKQHSVVLTTLCLVYLLMLALAGGSSGATRMPTFSLESVPDGGIVESEQLEGKVLLLAFFATWCPPCVEEVPTLNKLQGKFAGKGFSVIGISVDEEGPEIVAEFIKKQSIAYPVLMADLKTVKNFSAYSIPVVFLVNKSGNVVKRYTGYVQRQILEKDVQSLLN